MKALVAAAALSLATAASAGTVTVSRAAYMDDTGDGTPFVETGLKLFMLDTSTWVTGSLFTSPGVAPSIDVQSVSLHNLTTGESLSWAELVAVNWNTTRVGLEQWAFSARQLGAGEWTLDVAGTAWNDKVEQGFSAAVELPEPDAGALAVAAVLGALVATRRRKA